MSQEVVAPRQINLLEALGIMTMLAWESELHRGWYVADMEVNFLPPLQLGQNKFFFNSEGEPSAFATWALVDDETHGQLHCNGLTPSGTKWNSGDHLWFIDIVAPFGNTLHVIRDLQRNHFPIFMPIRLNGMQMEASSASKCGEMSLPAETSKLRNDWPEGGKLYSRAVMRPARAAGRRRIAVLPIYDNVLNT